MLMTIVMVLMTIYIIIPMVLTGYLFGIFLLQSSPMKLSDLRKLLGLFYRAPVFWLYINQVLAGSLRPITNSFFSKSGHYIVSPTILSFCFLQITIIFQIMTSAWQSKCSSNFEFIANAVFNARNKEEEYYFYVGKICGVNPWNPESS